MLRHPYVLIALSAAFIVLSASVVFSPSANHGAASTTAVIGAQAAPHGSAGKPDDRSELIRIFHNR
jgi:hypothetical protein